MYGPQAAYFSELFAGGFAPLIAAALLKWSG
jgi:hypothetical protein